jgi:hypothetical protein
MVTFLTGSFLVLIVLAIIVYLQRTRGKWGQRHTLSAAPPRFEGLFAERDAQLQTAAKAEAFLSARSELLRQAGNGDLQSLHVAAEMNDRELYEQTMDALIGATESDQQLFKLVSQVARDERLKVTPRLALRFFESWRNSPDRLTVAEILHVSALSNDASLYLKVCETAIDCWSQGRLPHIKADDLQTLIEGEYWILSAGTRGSGAGFVLKRGIGDLRRQLISRRNP